MSKIFFCRPTRKNLICGCAHAGIVNIVNKAKTLAGGDPTAVVGDFIFMSRPRSATKVTNILTMLQRHCQREKRLTIPDTAPLRKHTKKMQPRPDTRLTYLRTGSELGI